MSKDLYQKILDASNLISQSSRSGSANYIVTGTTFLEQWMRIERRETRMRKIKNFLEIM